MASYAPHVLRRDPQSNRDLTGPSRYFPVIVQAGSALPGLEGSWEVIKWGYR